MRIRVSHRSLKDANGETPCVTVLRIDSRTSFVDLFHMGHASGIGTGVLELSEGIGLVDPGPSTCLDALERGLDELGFALSDVRAILLTHVHLDHATASGAIVRRVPEARVYVHPCGANHMFDPKQLIASAARIYGDAMDTLWGEFLPVPEESVTEVDEGDHVDLGDRRFEVAYVPGHAKHHVAYFEKATSTAWVGDVGGIRIPPGLPVPVTPPPDIDVEEWKASMDRVMAWRPTRIVPTHFGPADDPAGHFAELRRGLDEWAEQVRRSLQGSERDVPSGSDPAADRARATAFGAWAVANMHARWPTEVVDAYTGAFAAEDSWWGLARYWRKRSSC